MKDIYRSFENFENERYLLRTVTMADAPALLQVYSDKHALPFFNSDNCHGDNFYDTDPGADAKGHRFLAGFL